MAIGKEVSNQYDASGELMYPDAVHYVTLVTFDDINRVATIRITTWVNEGSHAVDAEAKSATHAIDQRFVYIYEPEYGVLEKLSPRDLGLVETSTLREIMRTGTYGLVKQKIVELADGVQV